MPVKKKSVSPKKRKEFREAVNSLPGLIIEHVSFKDDATLDSKNKPISKYMLSNEKRLEHQKKRLAVFIGVGIIVLVLGILWVVNVRTFFFDTKHTLSKEEQLVDRIKQNFDTTVGLVSPRPTFPSSTLNNTVDTETLRAAVIAGLLSASSTPTSTSSSTANLDTTLSSVSSTPQTTTTTTSTP